MKNKIDFNKMRLVGLLSTEEVVEMAFTLKVANVGLHFSQLVNKKDKEV